MTLGTLYKNEDGVAQSDVKAAKWMMKAAKQGIVDAQDDMGLMYEHGRGVALSDVEAFHGIRRQRTMDSRQLS